MVDSDTNGFDLSATEFRDSLALRYHRPLLRLPALCDGCGSQFSTGHALDFRKGSLVIMRLGMPLVTWLQLHTKRL